MRACFTLPLSVEDISCRRGWRVVRGMAILGLCLGYGYRVACWLHLCASGKAISTNDGMLGATRRNSDRAVVTEWVPRLRLLFSRNGRPSFKVAFFASGTPRKHNTPRYPRHGWPLAPFQGKQGTKRETCSVHGSNSGAIQRALLRGARVIRIDHSLFPGRFSIRTLDLPALAPHIPNTKQGGIGT